MKMQKKISVSIDEKLLDSINKKLSSGKLVDYGIKDRSSLIEFAVRKFLKEIQ